MLTSHLANSIALCLLLNFLVSAVSYAEGTFMNLCTFPSVVVFVVFVFGVFFLPEAKSCIPIVQKIGNRFVLLECVGSLNGNWEEKEGTACSPVTLFLKSDSDPLKQ